jgi:hypothetical protein
MKNLFTLSLAVCFSLTVHSQIVFTDINPDSIYTEWQVHVVKLDTNRGGDTGEYYIWKHPVDVALNSYYLGCQTLCDASGYPFALEKGEPINASASIWRNTQHAYHILNNGSNGNWKGKNNHYLGVRFRVGTEFYYGWIMLDIDEAPSYLRVKEYAFESTANQPILAGQNGLASIPENRKTDAFNIYVSNKTLTIQQTIDISEDFEISIYNLMGKEVFSSDNFQTSYDLKHLESGIYIVQLLSAQEQFVQKLLF